MKGHGTKGLGTWVVPVYRYRFEKGHGTKGLGICMVPVAVCIGIDL